MMFLLLLLHLFCIFFVFFLFFYFLSSSSSFSSSFSSSSSSFSSFSSSSSSFFVFSLGAGCFYVGGPLPGELRRQHVVQSRSAYHLSPLIRNDTQCFLCTYHNILYMNSCTPWCRFCEWRQWTYSEQIWGFFSRNMDLNGLYLFLSVLYFVCTAYWYRIL